MSEKNKSSSSLTLLKEYWGAYGGCAAIVASRYTILSVIFSLALYPLWQNSDKNLSDIAISVLPNLLGFTLGGYAMFLAFGDRNFLKHFLKPNEKGITVYRSINSSFVHFMVVQIIGILWALLQTAYPFPQNTSIYIQIIYSVLFTFPGAFLFVYALALALAVTFNLFIFSIWYEKDLSTKPKEK